MKTTYITTVLGFGNHASIEIPPNILAELGANKRAPLKITINNYTYQSTATGVEGKCMVVFPQRDRKAAGVEAGDTVTVQLELDSGYREVTIPLELSRALTAEGLLEVFTNLTYSKRKEFARQVTEAKAEATKTKRVEKILGLLKSNQRLLTFLLRRTAIASSAMAASSKNSLRTDVCACKPVFGTETTVPVSLVSVTVVAVQLKDR